MKGNLYLIPSTIGDTPFEEVMPLRIREVINTIKIYIVENERTARRQLIKMGITIPINDLTFFVLDEHTNKESIYEYLNPCETQDVGLLSEAGVPSVADPGADIVNLAHKRNIKVIPLVGPSSILLALMASGLNGQCFAFQGYLPVKRPERLKKIKELEQLSVTYRQTQIFIEAPYRNNQMFDDLIEFCHEQTKVCIACNITMPDEFIRTLTVAEWKKKKPELHKKPAIFLLLKY